MALHDLTEFPQTDPTEIYRLRDGFYATDLVAAALVFLDFFSWLAEHPSDLPGICQQFNTTPRPTEVMLTLFAALGFVETREGVFHLTPAGREHLVKSSPWFIGAYYAALKDRPVCKDYLEVLRTGRPANWGAAKDGKDWHKSMEEAEFADRFTAAMDSRGVFLGAALARALDTRGLSRVLDVAGGSGIYACALVARHAHLRATVLEKPPVDAVARRAIERRGFSAKVDVVAGDMLASEFPGGCDAHLFSNVLHDWDVPVVKELLAKSQRALAKNGLLVIHDMHLNDTKTGPLPVAKYSALLMHATEGRCYGVAELRTWLGELGFAEVQFTPTGADRSIVTARKR